VLQSIDVLNENCEGSKLQRIFYIMKSEGNIF
jgi:hypothetical protein